MIFNLYKRPRVLHHLSSPLPPHPPPPLFILLSSPSSSSSSSGILLVLPCSSYSSTSSSSASASSSCSGSSSYNRSSRDENAKKNEKTRNKREIKHQSVASRNISRKNDWYLWLIDGTITSATSRVVAALHSTIFYCGVLKRILKNLKKIDYQSSSLNWMQPRQIHTRHLFVAVFFWVWALIMVEKQQISAFRLSFGNPTSTFTHWNWARTSIDARHKRIRNKFQDIYEIHCQYNSDQAYYAPPHHHHHHHHHHSSSPLRHRLRILIFILKPPGYLYI